MKKGDIVELEIKSYAFEGKGVAKINLNDNEHPFTVFVQGAYPGDKVKAFIYKKKKNYAEAKVEVFINKSEMRTTPKCSYFGVCGGCKQQDLDYKHQLKFKQEQVADIFEHLGGLKDFIMEPIVPSDNIFFYRNKMEYSFANKRWLTKEELNSENIAHPNFALGLHIPRMFDKVLDLEECFLQSELSSKILNQTRDFFLSRNASIYSTKTHEGYLRNLVIKQSHHTNDLMVNLVTSEDNSHLMNEYTKFITSKIPEITTVVNNVNAKKSQTAIGDFEKVYFGSGYIIDKIGDFSFRISSNSFFQTNSLQAEKLYKVALDFAGIKPKDVVYDLYSGAGTISTFVSPYAKRVFAIEAVKDAVEDAKVNLNINNISNIEFAVADLNKSFLPIIKSKNIPKPDIIIADPPRSGMNPKTIKDILELSPRQISYVSCNPTTQVRDIKMLIEGGYKLVKIRPVDMFPQTYHIENVAMLEKE